MEATLNRKERRRISKLAAHMEKLSARRDLVRIACARSCAITVEGEADSGSDFAAHITPYGIRYGEREADGFCTFKAYGPDGGHLFGWGGDGFDLLEEVSRSLQ